ncbi:ribosome maturation factor RimP [Caldisalinibacter kiritimatiensis]|uniref:Ribosome maturation factor RimP n=1 Tax=Caldisalinibacter kiritimatiensis TaxID=1304284 RepID=R1CVE7_9FIRM|nr:ribosome maturation factor RimP [Caldisalinibacter kiritimatiensis]EOD00619.1 hypothetical protein L21TH_1333 [Caldisalinibacter kiritimatiensis]
MQKKQVENLVLEIAQPIAEELRFELVDVEFVKEGPHKYLRIYIDKPGGISIEDCQEVSERVSLKLDEIDPIEEQYFLEVSSPGLDRPLKSDEDLESNLHNDVEVSLYKSLNGKKRLIGELIGFNDDEIEIDEEENGKVKIPRNIISRINLAVKF